MSDDYSGKQIRRNTVNLDRLSTGIKILDSSSFIGSYKTIDEVTSPYEYVSQNIIDYKITENTIDISGNGLSYGTNSTTGNLNLNINVDNITIRLLDDLLEVKGNLNSTHLLFGTSGNFINSSTIPVLVENWKTITHPANIQEALRKIDTYIDILSMAKNIFVTQNLPGQFNSNDIITLSNLPGPPNTGDTLITDSTSGGIYSYVKLNTIGYLNDTDWQILSSPGVSVAAVNGQTGNVILTTNDIQNTKGYFEPNGNSYGNNTSVGLNDSYILFLKSISNQLAILPSNSINYITISGSQSSQGTVLSNDGFDDNIDFKIGAKNNGNVNFLNPITLDGGITYPFHNINTNITLGSSNFHLDVDCSSSDISIGLPDVTTFKKGRVYNIKKIDNSSNIITVNAFTLQFIDGQLFRDIDIPYHNIMIISNGVNGWSMI